MSATNMRKRKTITLTVLYLVSLVILTTIASFIVYLRISRNVRAQSKIAQEQARSQMETELKQFEDKKIQYQNDIVSSRDTLQAISKQIADETVSLQKLQEEKDSIKVEVGKKQAQAEEAKKIESLKALDQKIKDSEAKLQKLNDDIATAKLEASKKTEGDQSKKTENDKLTSELASTKAELEKIKSRKDQIQTVDSRVEDLQKIKDLEAKIQELGNRPNQTIVQISQLDPDTEAYNAVEFMRILEEKILPLVKEINARQAYTYDMSGDHIEGDGGRIGHTRLLQVNYNRRLAQWSLNNCQWILWNLGEIEKWKGKKYRAYIARKTPRFSEWVAFNLKYDNKDAVGFSRETLNKVLDASGSENTDIAELTQTFQESFQFFMQPSFTDLSKIDDWNIPETLANADAKLSALVSKNHNP